MITPDQLTKSGTEHGEQMALFCWAAMSEQQRLYPELKWMYAIPNAGARGNKVAATQLVAEGVKSGVADICLPVRVQRDSFIYCGLYIEMKRKDGRMSDLSQKQQEFGMFVNLQGYEWRVAFGWANARDYILQYLNGLR